MRRRPFLHDGETLGVFLSRSNREHQQHVIIESNRRLGERLLDLGQGDGSRIAAEANVRKPQYVLGGGGRNRQRDRRGGVRKLRGAPVAIAGTTATIRLSRACRGRKVCPSDGRRAWIGEGYMRAETPVCEEP